MQQGLYSYQWVRSEFLVWWIEMWNIDPKKEQNILAGDKTKEFSGEFR
jgi:hypothetical protein